MKFRERVLCDIVNGVYPYVLANPFLDLRKARLQAPLDVLAVATFLPEVPDAAERCTREGDCAKGPVLVGLGLGGWRWLPLSFD